MKKQLLFLITLLCLQGMAYTASAQQDYFWVGGTGNWSDLNHWATTSGGTTKHSALPSEADNVYFDANSFPEAGASLSIDIKARTGNLDFSQASNLGNVSSNPLDSLEIFGNLSLGADVTYDLGRIYFLGAGNQEIRSNGKTLGSNSFVYLAGSTYTLLDDLRAGRLTVHEGHLVTNNYNVFIDFNVTFDISASASLGLSQIRGNLFEVAAPENCDALEAEFILRSLYVYNTTSVSPFPIGKLSSLGDDETISIYGNTVLFELNLEASNSVTFEAGTTHKIGAINANNTKQTLNTLKSSTEGVEAFLEGTINPVVTQYANIKDLHVTGAISFTANNSNNQGNTDGWIINAYTPLNYYWIGNGGNWSDVSHWATTSGGSTLHSELPGPSDNVYFDANSFTEANAVVTLAEPAICNDLSWEGALFFPRFTAANLSTISVNGNLTMQENLRLSLGNVNLLADNKEVTIRLGQEPNSYATYNVDGNGDFVFTEDFNASNLSIRGGTSTFDGVNVYLYNSVSFDGGIVNFTNSSLNVLSLNGTGSNASFTNSRTQIRLRISAQDMTFDSLVLSGNISVQQSTISRVMYISEGSSIILNSNTTHTVNEQLYIMGSAGSPVNISASNIGSPATISKTTGLIEANYANIQDISATGGADFTVQNGIDLGGNTGWTFIAPLSKAYYWVGNGGNWSDFANHWATSSGGTVFHSSPPSSLDSVFFDAASFTTDNEVVVFDFTSSSLAYLDLRGSNAFTFDGVSSTLNLRGSVYITENTVFRITDLNLTSSDEAFLALNSPTLVNTRITLNGAGTYTLVSPLFANDLRIGDAELYSGDFDMYIETGINFLPDATQLLDLGSSEIKVTRLTSESNSHYTVLGEASHLILDGQYELLPNFGSSSWGNVSLIADDFNNPVYIYGSTSFDTLDIQSGLTLQLASGITLEIEDIRAEGTPETPIRISGTNNDVEATISKTSGTVEVNYVDLQDIHATGGATFIANASLDLGNVLGWTFTKENQTIDFPAIASKSVLSAPFELQATASSGLEVSFELLGGPATLNGNVVSLTGISGEIRIAAQQAGNREFNASPSVINTILVETESNVINFPAISDKTYGDVAFELMATATSQEAPTLTVLSGPAEISNGILSITGVGEVTVQASGAGNFVYEEAPAVEQSFNISQAILEIAAADQSIVYGETLPEMTYSISGFVYNEDSTVLTQLPQISTSGTAGSDAGTYEITVSGASAINYDFSYVPGTLTIEKANQTMNIQTIETVSFNAEPFVIVAEASSGGILSYELVSGPATLQDSLVTLTGEVGTVVIRISQAGNINYFSISEEISFEVENVICTNFSLSLTNAQNISCAGGSDGAIDISVAGGTSPYTFSWSNGSATEDINSLSAGIYTLTVQDEAGCELSLEVNLSQPEPLQIDGEVSPVQNGVSLGAIVATVSGGTAPYTYAWSNGASTAAIDNLEAGEYTLSVTDAARCTLEATFLVEGETETCDTFAANIVGTSHITCAGGSDGAIDISVTGGTAPYTFAWSNGSTTEDINSLPSGTYSLTVQDEAGCELSLEVSLNQPEPLQMEAEIGNATDAGNDGSISVLVTGGIAPYTYLWSNEATTSDINGLSAGDYSLLVTDANGCTLEQSFTVEGTEILGISEGLKAWTIYPNPSNGMLSIAHEASKETIEWVRVMDSKGVSIEILSLQKENSFDLSYLPAGIYYVEWGASGNRYIAKWMKQ